MLYYNAPIIKGIPIFGMPFSFVLYQSFTFATVCNAATSFSDSTLP